MPRTRYPRRWHDLEPVEHHPQCQDRDERYVDPDDPDACVCDQIEEEDVS